jgi:hypothetical protein
MVARDSPSPANQIPIRRLGPAHRTDLCAAASDMLGLLTYDLSMESEAAMYRRVARPVAV